MSDIGYCRKCGTYLQLLNNGINHYDLRTGQPVFNAKKICPKKRGWFDGHDRWDGTLTSDGTFQRDSKYETW